MRATRLPAGGTTGGLGTCPRCRVHARTVYLVSVPEPPQLGPPFSGSLYAPAPPSLSPSEAAVAKTIRSAGMRLEPLPRSRRLKRGGDG
jgi:hypothetical protein